MWVGLSWGVESGRVDLQIQYYHYAYPWVGKVLLGLNITEIWKQVLWLGFGF